MRAKASFKKSIHEIRVHNLSESNTILKLRLFISRRDGNLWLYMAFGSWCSLKCTIQFCKNSNIFVFLSLSDNVIMILCILKFITHFIWFCHITLL